MLLKAPVQICVELIPGHMEMKGLIESLHASGPDESM